MVKHFVKGAVAVAALVLLPILGLAQQDFRNTVTGEPLDLSLGSQEGRDTPAVKSFLETGIDPYLEVKDCLPKGQEIFLVACSGCHGHVGEGKIGPGLNDNYWTYPKNKTDKGLFETIWGGARGQMGPHYDLPMDEIMLLIAWIRHLYTGPVEDADWLTPEQKKVFKDYDTANPVHLSAEGMVCKIPAS
jgi:cytochrome c-L